MCRRNMVLGYSLLAGGIGMLVALIVPGSFWIFVLATALIAIGIVLLNQ